DWLRRRSRPLAVKRPDWPSTAPRRHLRGAVAAGARARGAEGGGRWWFVFSSPARARPRGRGHVTDAGGVPRAAAARHVRRARWRLPRTVRREGRAVPPLRFPSRRRGPGGASPPSLPPLSVTGADLEASLLSFEKLDRASPDLWPEQRKSGGPAALCRRGGRGRSVGPGGCVCVVLPPSPPAALGCLFAVPGVAEFAASFKSPITSSPPKWMAELENDDIDMLKELGSLTTANLMEKVRGLQNLAYQLGLDECDSVQPNLKSM
uniref:Protein lin-52 homolog n=1 Tax=Calidris pygmaea TaxID=425635 RepID=A0A8C3JI52_9CHAR